MKCFLHVGTEKTATTTLQRFFDDHRGEMDAHGITYTRAAGVGNNWRLAVAAYDDDRHDDRSAAAGLGVGAKAGVDDAASRHRLRTSTESELQAELAAAGNDTVLFSSEHLHSRLTRPSEIERLAAILARLGVTDTTVVIYLRDPVALAASLFSTVVKHGGTARRPPPPATGTYFRHLCDHRAGIENWEAVFPSVVPRLFEPDTLTGGSIIDDILDVIGLSPSVILATSADADANTGNNSRLNPSLSAVELQVLSRVNERLPATIDGRPNPAHTDFVAALELHSVGPGFQLPNDLADQYRTAFAESNEWVRARFFPERDHLFAAEHPAYERPPPQPGFDGLVELLITLWTAQTGQTGQK